MTPVDISVLVGAAVLSALVIWFFFLSEKEGTRLAASNGVQEANIVVKGGYTPDVLVVKAGQPVRLNFTRQETASCSEMVLFPDFNRSAKLPTGETVTIEFTPEKPGEYDFQCQMGMLHGKLIVE
ncbi:MAG: cupredoxin domain-containing protein [Caldilineae bacterium]|nr:MAG: cupredoxin domain-containing protein [Caldilineae bacterium]